MITRISRECAALVYGSRPPTPLYADSVARLLMGTAAAESLLRYRRQMGFSLDSLTGAWGLWQTESAAVGDNILYLRRRADVRRNASVFVYGDEGELNAVLGMNAHGLLRLIHDDDRFACLMARVHYLRVAEAVPLDLYGQAGYWKRYYNTRLGKGTVAGYVAKFNELIEPML